MQFLSVLDSMDTWVIPYEYGYTQFAPTKIQATKSPYLKFLGFLGGLGKAQGLRKEHP